MTITYQIVKCGRKGKIVPIPTGILEHNLSKKLSYEKMGKEFMPNPSWAIVRLYSTKTGVFPWGMIGTVRKIFDACNKKTGDNYSVGGIPELVINEENIKKLSPKLREYQKDAIINLIMNHGGLVSLPTGAGKTFMCVEYLKYMNKKSLVIVPTLVLKEQWNSQVPDYVDVTTYQSIKDMKILDKYSVVVWDEVHHLPSKTIYKIAMNTKNAILVGVSATISREDGEEMKIQAAIGDIVYHAKRNDMIKLGFLADASVKYLKLEKHCNDRFLDYKQIYKNFIVFNEERNLKIVDIVKKHKNDKILILISEIVHGEELKVLFDINKIKTKFLHGKTKDRTINDDDMVIIGSNIFNEGVDIPDFKVLVLAAGGKSGIQLTQRVGRVLRPKNGMKAFIYDFIDDSKYLVDHYKRRRAILEEDFSITL